jgi:hypothetical protein
MNFVFFMPRRAASRFISPGERFLGAGDQLGERDAGVVAGLDDHPADQLVHRDGLARIDEHARAGRAPCTLRHGYLLIERDLFFLERHEYHVRAHQLRQRRRLEPLVGLLRGQNLAARQIGEHPGPGDH